MIPDYYTSRISGGSMGGNQQLALDANFSTWKNNRTLELAKDINPFEYFCLENYLRDWVDSDEDVVLPTKTGHLS
jgi:hypothetical protein